MPRPTPWLAPVPILALVLCTPAPGQAQPRSGGSAVVDGAKLFSPAAIDRAREDIARIERDYGVQVTIETVDSLGGQGIDEFATRRAEMADRRGIFVLIAREDRKAEALASPRALFDDLGKARLNEVRDAILQEFRDRRMDEGLAAGIRTAARNLEAIRPARRRELEPNSRPMPRSNSNPIETAHAPTISSSGTSGLILRQQVRLSLAGARKVLTGAEAEATRLGVAANLAVVDDGGHLLAFARMDNARPASATTAQNKAISAATFRRETGPIAPPPGGDPLLHNLGIEHAADGKVTILPGGIPIIVDGQVIGAIGVGGGSGNQDAEIARAGVAAFAAEVQQPAPRDRDGFDSPR